MSASGFRLTSLGLILGTALGIAAPAHAEVNVYSLRQPFLIQPMLDAFTEETGIPVNVVFAKDGLVERLEQEGVNSPADLILTVDIGRLQDLLDADLVQPVESDVLEANIPAQFRHPDGLWHGLTLRARIFATAKDRVEAGALTSYEDLADPQWEGRICTRSGKHVYNVALIASMIEHHGAEETEQWLTGVKNNLAQKPQGGDRDQVKAISEGVCDVAVLNNYYMGAMLRDEQQSAWAKAVDIVFPNQDDRGTHVNISGVAMAKGAPNRDDALKLMEFLSGDAAQQMYAELNDEYPVNPDVPRSELLTSWGEFKMDELSLDKVAQSREEAIKMVDRVGYDN